MSEPGGEGGPPGSQTGLHCKQKHTNDDDDDDDDDGNGNDSNHDTNGSVADGEKCVYPDGYVNEDGGDDAAAADDDDGDDCKSGSGGSNYHNTDHTPVYHSYW